LLSAKQVEPGQSGEIEVNIKTEGLTTLSKSVNVTTNDPRQPFVRLTITGVVQPEFVLSERSIYFGLVPKGKEATKEIVITIPPEKAVKVLSAESTDQSVTVRLEPIHDSNGKKVRLVAVQRAEVKEGYHSGTITIKTTSALTPELKLSVRGIITADQPK
jgi:hypothetical protein